MEEIGKVVQVDFKIPSTMKANTELNVVLPLNTFLAPNRDKFYLMGRRMLDYPLIELTEED